MVSPVDESHPAGAAGAPSLDGLLGRLVAGKFEIVELLGSGAMGAVYRAEQVALDKHVALKILHPSLRQDATFVRRFHREAKAAAALEHPNSVSILDFGEEPDGLLYIAMEYLDGRDLFQVIQEEWPLSKERIVSLMRQVCGAVARAHDTGVVHRDLKPENIMVMSRVGDDGEQEEVVKVCDFGIAHLQKSPDESAAGKGLLVGTPEYMAPEVARGEEPDGRSDLYALGVVLYQILTKRLPFEGGDPLRVAMQHVQE
ncbi:serine/threonine protein kinase, partial [bacterium]